MGEPLLTNDEIDVLCEKININEPPRILVTVSGGNADYTHDEPIDVLLFDFDNYRCEPKAFEKTIPERFNKMADQMGIPDDCLEKPDNHMQSPDESENSEEGLCLSP